MYCPFVIGLLMLANVAVSEEAQVVVLSQARMATTPLDLMLIRPANLANVRCIGPDRYSYPLCQVLVHGTLLCREPMEVA